jgi:hypothetical protein
LPGHSLSVSRRIVTKGLRLHVQGDPSGQAALAHLCEGNISPCDGESLLAFASSCVQSSCDLYLISWFPFASTFWGRHCSGGEPSSLTPFRPLFNVVSTDSAGQGASAGRDAIRNAGPLTLALVPRTGERGIEISQSAHAPSWSGLFHLPCTGIWHVVEEICCSHTSTSTPLRRSCLDPEHENGFRNDRVAGLELSCVTMDGNGGHGSDCRSGIRPCRWKFDLLWRRLMTKSLFGSSHWNFRKAPRHLIRQTGRSTRVRCRGLHERKLRFATFSLRCTGWRHQQKRTTRTVTSEAAVRTASCCEDAACSSGHLAGGCCGL